MLSFSSEVCSNLEESVSREWLETNGLGGFACSTISGINTRRYHSLLTVALHPPVKRYRLLSKFEETLFLNGRAYNLSANFYPNTTYPGGYKYIKRFMLRPIPTWVFEIGDLKIQKSLFMPHEQNAIVCRYRVLSSSSNDNSSNYFLYLRPLLCFTDYHSLQHENPYIDTTFEQTKNLVSMKPYETLPKIFFAHNAIKIEPSGHWYRNFEYPIELERGFDFHEDLFQPFIMQFSLDQDAIVIASTERFDIDQASQLEECEIERRKLLVDGIDDEFLKELTLAADQFVVKRNSGHTIIAGYPWFSDWGRDTFVSLNGLTLATNRPAIARSILKEFSNHISKGMIPNYFTDEGEPQYNTADATLWYFEAVRAYAEVTGDYDFVKEHLYEKLADIIAWHLRGTRFQIHVDTDGLLFAGEANSQITWMDAKVNDIAVTPRIGKPVEIQALWFNALKTMANFAQIFGDDSESSLYKSMAEMARYSFNQLFWNEDEKCLFDVISNGERDASVRPNQIFAVSLPFSMVDAARAKKIVEKVEKELLTPFGLRSLSPKDNNYHSKYSGPPSERDSAYHQGTVWAWLIGAFIDAHRKVFPNDEQKIKQIIENFKAHLRSGCIGQISEIFDAEAPHLPRGCFAQAWSVAEVIRIVKSLQQP